MVRAAFAWFYQLRTSFDKKKCDSKTLRVKCRRERGVQLPFLFSLMCQLIYVCGTLTPKAPREVFVGFPKRHLERAPLGSLSNECFNLRNKAYEMRWTIRDRRK